MLRIHLSMNDGVPIYQQIVNQIKYLIASSQLTEGDELPPIRVLAEQLVINPNTVARAYRELEISGVVEKRRTNGTYVAGVRPLLQRRERLRILTERIDALLAETHQMDINVEEVIDLLLQRDKAMKSSAREIS